jgi:RNA polymerase sigma-70 factor (ECF subfamily)
MSSKTARWPDHALERTICAPEPANAFYSLLLQRGPRFAERTSLLGILTLGGLGKPLGMVRADRPLNKSCGQLNFLPPDGSIYCETHVSANAQQLYEQTLVIRSQIGDELAFQELLTLYGPHLLLFTRKMLQTSPHLVEDVTQEIWLAIYKGLPGLLDAGKFRPWAFRIARDRIYREYRRRQVPPEPLGESHLEMLPEAGEASAAVDVEKLHRGLGAISPEHREVLVLYFFEEMSYEDIAGVTSSTLGTVRSRIHYAKRALRNALERKTT